MKGKAKHAPRVIYVKQDPLLDSLKGKDLFPEKLAEMNKTLENIKLPDLH